MRQTGLLDRDKFAILVFFGEGMQVDDAGDSSSNQPRQSQDTVDAVEDTNKDEIIVVSLSVLELVALVVYQVPCDTVKTANDVSECAVRLNSGFALSYAAMKLTHCPSRPRGKQA